MVKGHENRIFVDIILKQFSNRKNIFENLTSQNGIDFVLTFTTLIFL